MPVLNFASFGNTSRYPQSLSRIEGEARALGIFTDVYVWNENDLDPEFLVNHGRFMQRSRGYGYWIWKPQVILQALRKTPPGGFLLYTDAGCTFNANAKARIFDYVAMAEKSPKSVFGFHLPEHKESAFNKMDTVFTVFGPEVPIDVLRTPQCVGGINVWHNTPAAVAFVEEWLDVCTRNGYRYVDDSPSRIRNLPDFNEHRHDQAIYSLLIKKYKVPTLSDETYHPQWHLQNWPIHAARLRE